MSSIELKVVLTLADRLRGSQRYTEHLYGEPQRLASGRASMIAVLACFIVIFASAYLGTELGLGGAAGVAALISAAGILVLTGYGYVFRMFWLRGLASLFARRFPTSSESRIAFDTAGITVKAEEGLSAHNWSAIRSLDFWQDLILIDTGCCAIIIPTSSFADEATLSDLVDLASKAGVAVIGERTG